MQMRRGHRLHSVHGAEQPDMAHLARLHSTARSSEQEERREKHLWTAMQNNDLETVESMRAANSRDPWNWSFIQSAVGEAVRLGSAQMVTALVSLFTASSPSPYKVGELATIVATSSCDTQIVLAIFQFWLDKNSFEQITGLDVVALAVHASVCPHTSAHKMLKKKQNISSLAETAIYVATVDRLGEVLKDLLEWVKDHGEVVGPDIEQINADCILHAALEGDRDQLRILYMAGYRLGADTTRRVNKDYLKKIKLFRARASPTYCAVAFEQSQDVNTDDPMKRCLEYSLQARHYAATIQDFNSEYCEVAQNCDNFAITLLEKCTTKHEIQTLLQTKSYRGHHDANFNVCILDGHKEIVAHEKFQQLLHKKWGQRDKIHYGDDIRYNIFWSEMGKLQKIGHMIKQAICYFLLPLVFLLTSLAPGLAGLEGISTLVMQSHIPVNRFIYYEISKVLFLLLIFITLVEQEASAWLAVLCGVWIFSYFLEDFRTIYRLNEQGEGRLQTMRRWLTFRNVMILVTNLTFLVALILRFLAYQHNQCRDGSCPYEGNKMAFIGGCLWAVAALLTFLRSIQTGLMYRQTGPIIISMSYMIVDVGVFLFIFVIVYISFTLCTVYIYNVYDEDRTQFFNNHKTAFKLFYWTLIRTGNPHFPNIRSYDSTLHFYNSSCLGAAIQEREGEVDATSVAGCALGRSGVVGEFDSDIEEGVPYITGNILWAVYQFIVFIVLLSVLRARMVNTYHRIFREADVQWKFFRASIWWKYLDHNSILPPPFTLVFLLHSAASFLRGRCQAEKNELAKEDLSLEKQEFNKRYRRLLLTLVQPEETSWGFSQGQLKKASRSRSNKSMGAAGAGGD